jgi:hypothetical protein
VLPTVPTAAQVAGPPRWLDLLVRSAAFAVLSLGLVGLPLALLGELRRVPTAVGAAVVFGLLHLLWSRRDEESRQPTEPPVRAAGRTGSVVAGLAVLLAMGSGAVNSSQHYEHLIVDGDPAVYAVTGALLARTGSLTVPTQEEELYAGNDTLSFTGAGFFEVDGEPAVYPQFFHLLPVLLAVGSWLGGTTLLLMVNPILGAVSLLAFYSFAARVVRPVWALLSTATLAVLLPQLHFSRDVFSEIPSQLLVFAGLALLWDVTGPRRASGRAALAGGLVAGLVLGGSMMARIDAFLYVVPVAVALLLLGAGRTGLAVIGGMAVPAAVALADGHLGSPAYLESVAGPLLQTALALLLVGAAAGALRLLSRDGLPGWFPRLGARLAWPVAAATVALSAAAWFVRPSVQVTRRIPERTNDTIAGLQQAEGLPVDVPRSYDEQTMLWLSWYLGPVALALGVLGLAYLSWRVLRGRDLRLAPLVLLVGLVTAVYVWHPGIFPVQYWATRRFLPVSFPGLVLLAVLLCSAGWERWRGRLRLLPAAGAAAVLAFPLALLPGATLPRSYAGTQEAFEQMCGSLLPDDVVLLVGQPVPLDDDGDPRDTFSADEPAPKGSLPQAVQGYCGVAAASATAATGERDLREIRAAAAAQGRRLVLLSPVPDPAGVPAGTEFRPVYDRVVPTQALSLSTRPDEVFPYRVRLFLAVL